MSKRKSSNKWQEDDIEVNEPLLKKSKQTKPKQKKLKLRNNQNVTKRVFSNNDLDMNNKNQCSNDSNGSDDNVYDIDTHQWHILGVSTPIIKALKDQHFYQPTPIQALTLPPAILGHRDILGAAETGSGKTLAFGIPIINGILELKNQLGIESEKKVSKIIENKGWICSDNEIVEDDSLSESDYEEDIKNFDENCTGCVRVINNIKISNTQNSTKPLYALILTPTRELAIQIKDHLTKIIKYTDIKVSILMNYK